MKLTDEIILKIDDLLNDWALLAIEITILAINREDLFKRYINDDIFIEYYNGIKEGRTADQMRKIYLPKYIRRELNKNN